MVLIGEEKKYSQESSWVPPKRSQGIHSQPQNPGLLVNWDKEEAKICSAHQHCSPLLTPWRYRSGHQPGTNRWYRSWRQLESSLSCSSHITGSLRRYLWNISKHHPFLSSPRQATVFHQALFISAQFWTSLSTGLLALPPSVPRVMVLNHRWGHSSSCSENTSWTPTAKGKGSGCQAWLWGPVQSGPDHLPVPTPLH